MELTLNEVMLLLGEKDLLIYEARRENARLREEISRLTTVPDVEKSHGVVDAAVARP